jgi:hypothetical protein
MDQDIYDELPTKYDLYYFRWRYVAANGCDIMEVIISKISDGSIDEQLSEKYLYYLFIYSYSRHSFDKNREYIIVTDDCTLSTNSEYLKNINGDQFQSNDKYFILNLRGREFLIPGKYECNLLGDLEEIAYQWTHNDDYAYVVSGIVINEIYHSLNEN